MDFGWLGRFYAGCSKTSCHAALGAKLRLSLRKVCSSALQIARGCSCCVASNWNQERYGKVNLSMAHNPIRNMISTCTAFTFRLSGLNHAGLRSLGFALEPCVDGSNERQQAALLQCVQNLRIDILASKIC